MNKKQAEVLAHKQSRQKPNYSFEVVLVEASIGKYGIKAFPKN